jgi:hypothetical protein
MLIRLSANYLTQNKLLKISITVNTFLFKKKNLNLKMASEVIAIIGSVAGITKTLIEISKAVSSFGGCAGGTQDSHRNGNSFSCQLVAADSSQGE